MRRHLLVALPGLLTLASACAPATQGGGMPTDRVLTTDMQGQVIRQNSVSDHATVTFAGPTAKVYTAVVAAYADLALPANYADAANNRYGVRNYNFPRNLNGQRINTIFSCGSSLTGDLVDNGTVNSEIITSLTPTPEGQTTAVIYVAGWVKRNEGNASNPVACTSTGRLEEMIRKSIETRLAAK